MNSHNLVWNKQSHKQVLKVTQSRQRRIRQRAGGYKDRTFEISISKLRWLSIETLMNLTWLERGTDVVIAETNWFRFS